jgi:hypothetical protein
MHQESSFAEQWKARMPFVPPIGIERKVACPHKFQLYVDYGYTNGPWIAIGVNSIEYAIGWLPEDATSPAHAVPTLVP